MKKILLLVMFLSCLSTAKGQERTFGDVVKRALMVTNKKGFRGQYLKGKRNGMGIVSMKKDSYFVGDFYRDDITGYGMLIASNKGSVDNCADCAVYVGNWREGKKSGFGTCYDNNGYIMYQGQFDNDRPTGKYPSDDVDQQKRFLSFGMENGNMFLGETKDGYANGYGIIVFKNFDIWLSSFKDGKGKGIGLYMFENGEWETFNCRDDNYSVVSSSENYKKLDAIKKQNVRDGVTEALLGISSALGELANTMEQQNGTAVNAYSSESGNGHIQNISGSQISHNTAGRCKRCSGSGRCSPTSGAGLKNACNGSGLCQYCNGTKWIKAGSSETTCTACKGTGKCKTCNGTGRCSVCRGSGKG